MRRRTRAVPVLPQFTVSKTVSAGVALAVPTTGALLAAAPALAAPGDTTTPAAGAPGSSGTATAPSSSPVLSYGSRGSSVVTIQTKLGVAADGFFGPLTLSAVKSFQSAQGLVPDGVVGALTWAKLGVSAPTTGTSPAPTTGTPTTGTPTTGTTTPSAPTTPSTPTTCTNATTVRYGSTSPLVKVLQGRLGLVVDGWFGPLTEAKVVAFQTSNGIQADGIVGPLTWAKLGCTGTSVPSTPTTPTSPTTPTTPTTPTVPTTPTSPSTSTSAAQIIAFAKTFSGTPYLWGGSSPAGFDCSGLTSYVFKNFGYTMPRTAAQQQAYFTPTSNPQPGDLLFYGAPAYHVAIYLGNGMMLDAPHPGAVVGVRAIYGSPSGYARVLK